MKIVGIDFSIQCPCLAIFNGDIWSYNKCQFYYLTSKKKFQFQSGQFIGHEHFEYLTQEERFDQSAEWILQQIPKDAHVYMEGYSYGSKLGLMYNIAEATSILKHKLYKNNISFQIVPPTVIKKTATGKGNANKIKMHESFLQETNVNLLKELNINVIGSNPQSDIVDSYFIAKYGFYDQKIFV